jgi:release factor glutamine methyltransferase
MTGEGSGPMAAGSIGDLLARATARLRESGSESARLDAQLLLGHVLGMARAGLLANSALAVPPAHAAEFEAAVERRSRGEPVAYIRGIKEFFGLAFAVDERALIPRPETERLVELCLERIRTQLIERPRPAGAAPLLVWDVGTGSGAIAVSLAVECRRRGYADDVRVRASDISADALALATENAVSHGVADMVELKRSDLLGDVDHGPADLIAANLPYVPSADVPELPVAASFEPALALDGGPDGLAVVRRLLDGLPSALATGAVALLEIGSDQAGALAAEVEKRLPGWVMQVHADLGGQPRVAELIRP